MSAFFGAIGVVGILAGIVLMIMGWIKKKKYRGGLITLASLVLFVVSVVTTPPAEETSKPVKDTPKAVQTQNVSWEDKVKEVAASKGTESEKFEAISAFVKNYQPTQDEIKEFGDYIVKEYKDKKYIMDITNHEYMLGNIFKAAIVEKHSNDVNMKNFAYDFWQNSKYNYRKVDTMTSESTLSNEKQMDKALKQMGK